MVSVCDAIMGSGKSSACINYMNQHPEKRYLYITPYLTEAARIKDGCPALHFHEPSKKNPATHFNKTEDAAAAMKEGRNIASTHEAFSYYTPDMIEIIRDQRYTLMIDESVNVLQQETADPGNIEVLVEGGYVETDGVMYSRTSKEFHGTFCQDFMRQLKSREFYHVNGDQYKSDYFFWVLSIEFLLAFDDVIIMTYMFHGQDMYFLMKLHGIDFKYIGVTKDEDGYHFCDDACGAPEYTRALIDKIHICDIDKLNEIGKEREALSMNWFNKSGNRDMLRKRIRSYFEYHMKHFPSEERLYGTYKNRIDSLARKGYTDFGIVFNSRATNEYSNKHLLAYAANLFYDGARKKFFSERGVRVNEDLYALSTMVQWIWRSAIRNGEEIWIYIPSRRMRELLQRWLDDLAAGGTGNTLPAERGCVADGEGLQRVPVAG